MFKDAQKLFFYRTFFDALNQRVRRQGIVDD